MNKNLKKMLFGIFCSILVQAPSSAINETVPDIIQQTGSINAHDMENLKHLETEQKIQEDFKTYKQRAEKKEKAEKSKKRRKKKIKQDPMNMHQKVYI